MNSIWTTERQAIARKEAARWIGTPHRDRLAKLGIGIDCINYVNEILIATEIVPRAPIGHYNTIIGLHEPSDRLKRAIKLCVECDDYPATTAPEFGDIVIFKTGKFSGHCGIIIDGAICHSLANRTVTQSLFAEWQHEIDCFLRIKAIGLIGEPHIAGKEI